jgi:5-methylcytosine-specific restriction protein B
VQFHPAYSYEDFIAGIRPRARKGGGLAYPVVPGRFVSFCEKASRLEGRSVLILDEINRANLARVFGELMYLLEYRDETIPLASGRTLSIPKHVRIVGTMNTADRSIALVDHALRRRFAFLGLYPNLEVLRRYHAGRFQVDGLVRVLGQLNEAIRDDNYAVGISFFMREDIADSIEDVWRMEIEPYLEEYFFDRKSTLEQYRWKTIRTRVLDAAGGEAADE